MEHYTIRRSPLSTEFLPKVYGFLSPFFPYTFGSFFDIFCFLSKACSEARNQTWRVLHGRTGHRRSLTVHVERVHDAEDAFLVVFYDGRVISDRLEELGRRKKNIAVHTGAGLYVNEVCRMKTSI